MLTRGSNAKLIIETGEIFSRLSLINMFLGEDEKNRPTGPSVAVEPSDSKDSQIVLKMSNPCRSEEDCLL